MENTTTTTEYHFTDLGNAERLVDEHGADLRFSDSHGWLAWTGANWEADSTAEVERRAMATVRSMYAAAAKIEDSDGRRQLIDFAVKCEARRRIVDMVALAQAHERIRIRADALDRDRWLLNVHNGTIDLRTGALRPQRREDLITRCCPVVYDPKSTAPRWATFLDEIMDGADELVEFIRRAIGYSLTGDTSERAVFLLHGSGRNGKSTVLHVIRTLLGPYAIHARSDLILAKRGESIPCDLARLQGARFVSITETEEGRRLETAKLKEMTGGTDPITARFLRQNEFTFLPEFKPWIATNSRPMIYDDSEATWDRLYCIPFDVRIPEDRIDKHLSETLIAELPGVLAWAVAGCLDWQAAGGLQPPDQVMAAKREYQAQMDTFGQWRGECTTSGNMVQARAGKLYASYKSWCESRNMRAANATRFGMRMTAAGFEKTTGAYVTYHGIGLVCDSRDSCDTCSNEGSAR